MNITRFEITCGELSIVDEITYAREEPTLRQLSILGTAYQKAVEDAVNKLKSQTQEKQHEDKQDSFKEELYDWHKKIGVNTTDDFWKREEEIEKNKKIVDVVKEMFNAEPSSLINSHELSEYGADSIKHRINTKKWVFDTIKKRTNVDLRD